VFNSNGQIQARSPRRLPDCPPDREHPKDTSLSLRRTTVYDADHRKVGFANESIKKIRHGLTTGRSKLAVSGSSSKTQVFLAINRAKDSLLDGGSRIVTPARSGRTRGLGGLSGGGLRRKAREI
jgi:hypothetical protein